MARLLFGCLLSFALVATGLQAEGYDDFSLGMSAVNRSDNDKAIAHFTSALAAGDLHTSLVPVAYLERARAYLGKNECPQAFTDTAAALKLKPAYFEAYLIQARASSCVGDDSTTMADLNQLIALRPYGDAYWSRGRLRWKQGDLEGAAADFSAVTPYSPKWPYSVLWFGLAKLRAGTFDATDFAGRSSDFDSHDWPAPVFRLYEGKMKPEDVLVAAAKGDAAKDNTCEARFYVAEWWLTQKNMDAAKPLLHDAQNDCRHDFIEYSAAVVELGRLK